jgi:hypothetical protein
MENMREVEINGVKFEVDMRCAKQINTYRVGDRVKVLVKIFNSYASRPGVIVGFDDFKKLPTIIVLYLEDNYGSADLKFVYMNATSEDIEICPDTNELNLELNKARVIEKLDNEVQKKRLELEDLERKKEYFLTKFGVYFGESE